MLSGVSTRSERAAALGLRAVAALLVPLPEPVARGLGRGVARLAYPFAGVRRRMLRRHLTRVTGDASLARQAYASYGRYWAEMLWADPQRADAIVEHAGVEGWAHVEAARSAGRGMVFALPHLGSWDVAGLLGAQRGLDLLAVAEIPAHPELEAFFAQRRRGLGIEVARADGSTRLAMQLVGHLREGGAVALLCDRDLAGDGPRVEFFGEETSLPAGPAVLALRTGAALLPAGAYFRPGRGHRLVVEPKIEIPPAPTSAARIHATTQSLAQALERVIRAAPDQWHLLQPNWPSDGG